MKQGNKYSLSGIAVFAGILFLSIVLGANPALNFSSKSFYNFLISAADSDTTIRLPFPFKDRVSDKYSSRYSKSPLYLKDPANIQSNIEYERGPGEYGQYNTSEKVGSMFYRNPNYLTFDEYVDNEFKNSTKKYWRQRAGEEDKLQKKALIPKLHVNNEIFDRIFGGNTVDIRPQGSAELTFQIRRSTNANPALPIRQQKPPPLFDFDQKIQMNVIGNIGDKMKLNFNYNTEATFDFENQMKLNYTGKEDEIIKKIEAGNVSLPLSGSLITGSQSLFGIKTALQFGHLTVTSIFSQEKGKKSTITVTGGAQTNLIDIRADNYEANKHFFLGQFFRDHYDAALANTPIISSSVNITKIEVWVTNKTNAVDNTRNIVAFMDLGEQKMYNQSGTIPSGSNVYPDNASNGLYNMMTKNYTAIRNITQVNSTLSGLCSSINFCPAVDYEKMENAKKLSPSEYTLNSRLGFISLNQALNANEILAVAYEYTVGNAVYKVGEFSTDGISAPQALCVKLLKNASLNPKLPTWKLMMKNIYSVGAYNISPKNFVLEVMYDNATTGIPVNYLPASGESKVNGVRLIKLFNLDRLNTQNSQVPDGVFDFIDGVTINAANGRVIFPVVEPFGKYLRTKFSNKSSADYYAFDFLYDSTKTKAQQDLEHDKFSLKGSYESSSGSEISLNAWNIPQGAVTVTAGGARLVENTDYTVDYTSGKVKIINAGILNSGTPIQISLESNALFNIQTKTLLGSRFDYVVDKNFNFGATILHLNERPLTQKVSIGDEPISNTIWGLDGTYRTDSRFITRMIDKLPFYSTKELSTVTVTGEFAQLIPGHSKLIGTAGTSYIDDFEGTKSTIDIKPPSGWILASTPQQQPSLFPEASATTLAYGFNRAKLAWYAIDQFFYDNTAPDYILNNNNLLSDHFVRQVLETELFPAKQYATGQTTTALSVLNLAYYPTERGPYNFDVAGLNTDGTLKNPSSRWAGIMRKIETTDFEASNVEFIEFWMMDPFVYKQTSGGELYFNLGNISEDILKDSRKCFENGLPTSATPTNVDTTIWGRVPTVQSLVNAFDNDPAARQYQDVGFDGLSDVDERDFFKNTYINPIVKLFGTSSTAYKNANNDPSADDYHYFRGTSYFDNKMGILDLYKQYNGVEGNSVTTQNSPESYPTSATNIPDNEDVNKDNTLNEAENYYQYRVELKPSEMVVGRNYITDIVTGTGKLKNNNPINVKWYHFKIPLQSPNKRIIGSISDFKSIQFMRMFLKGFEDPIVCRFAKLQLVRDEWRKYDLDLQAPGAYILNDDAGATTFDLTTVNLEENGSRQPIKYVIPPGFERPTDPTSPTLRQMNEQSMALKVCNLEDGDARATYKNLSLDVRNYKKLKMFVHSEAGPNNEALKKGDLTLFVRLGTDFTSNYYEYEIPLNPSPNTATSPEDIWRDSLNIDLEKLYQAKQQRDKLMESNPALYSIAKESPAFIDGTSKIRVKGMPKLNEVKTIMIGVRNPKKTSSTPEDDGNPKCGEIWVNELRLSDFVDEGGWAANARVNTKLADLGNLNLAGGISTFGFGSLEQKMNERKKTETKQYDASSSIELGKFLPTKFGIRIPMYVGFSQSWTRPKYNPLEPDVPLETALDAITDKVKRDTVLWNAEDYMLRRSLNFTNVKKEKKGGGKSHFYDVENINLSFSYSYSFRRSPSIEYDIAKSYRGGLGYVFSNSPKNISPFTKVKLLNPSYLKLIKDFNFYYLPSSFSFRADLDRQYKETLLRNTTGSYFPMDTTVNKSLTMIRLYDVKFDLTKSVKFDFQATNNSVIDERPGRINRMDADYKQDVDTIKDNLYKVHLGGRTMKYHHTGNLSYNIPINKFPLTDWISSTARYGFGYDWTAAPQTYDTLQGKLIDNPIGNVIQNSNTKQINGDFNMVTLYNKVPYLRNLSSQKSSAPKPTPKPIVRVLKTHADSVQAKKDSLQAKKDSVNIVKIVFDQTLKVLMGIKRASFTYSETNGMLLPGYTEKTQLMGMSPGFKAPTLGFIMGDETDIRNAAGKNGWITKDTSLNTLFTRTYLSNFTARSNIEPFAGVKIELTANRNFSQNHSENYKYNSTGDSLNSYGAIETGNFSMSFLSFNTAFEKEGTDHSSKAFDDFLKVARQVVSRRLSNGDPTAIGGFRKGYGGTSQEVLIPAFIAAYSGKNPEFVDIKKPFPMIPKPNWRVTYDGLSKFKWVQKYFSSISVAHAYRSTYNINSYTTNLHYKDDGSVKNDTGDYVSQHEIMQVSISEQFAPLISVDMSWKNSLLTRMEIKKTRDISLSLANNQLTETKGTEYVFGAGYRIKKFNVPFKIKGKKIQLKNDLNCKADVSIRNNITVTRKIVEEVNQATGGMQTVMVKVSVDYVINERFNIRVFYDRAHNEPKISTSFPTTNWSAGVSVRFTLAQ